ncbi:hypothetical protein ACWY4P_48890 [Streptomyces sp. LZ34]
MFLADGECWGALAMFRRGDRADFTPGEAALVRVLSRPVAVALRRACIDAAQVAPSASAGPGVLVLDGGGRTLVANEPAQRWLDEIGTLAPHEVSAAARAGRGEEAYLRVRSRTGRWLSLWGSPLDGKEFVLPALDAVGVMCPSGGSGFRPDRWLSREGRLL